MPHSLAPTPEIVGTVKLYKGTYYVAVEQARQEDGMNPIECNGCHLKGADGICPESAFHELDCGNNGDAVWNGIGG